MVLKEGEGSGRADHPSQHQFLLVLAVSMPETASSGMGK